MIDKIRSCFYRASCLPSTVALILSCYSITISKVTMTKDEIYVIIMRITADVKLRHGARLQHEVCGDGQPRRECVGAAATHALPAANTWRQAHLHPAWRRGRQII